MTEGKELDYRFHRGSMGKSGNDPEATFRFLVKREKVLGECGPDAMPAPALRLQTHVWVRHVYGTPDAL